MEENEIDDVWLGVPDLPNQDHHQERDQEQYQEPASWPMVSGWRVKMAILGAYRHMLVTHSKDPATMAIVDEFMEALLSKLEQQLERARELGE